MARVARSIAACIHAMEKRQERTAEQEKRDIVQDINERALLRYTYFNLGTKKCPMKGRAEALAIYTDRVDGIHTRFHQVMARRGK